MPFLWNFFSIPGSSYRILPPSFVFTFKYLGIHSSCRAVLDTATLNAVAKGIRNSSASAPLTPATHGTAFTTISATSIHRFLRTAVTYYPPHHHHHFPFLPCPTLPLLLSSVISRNKTFTASKPPIVLMSFKSLLSAILRHSTQSIRDNFPTQQTCSFFKMSK